MKFYSLCQIKSRFCSQFNRKTSPPVRRYRTNVGHPSLRKMIRAALKNGHQVKETTPACRAAAFSSAASRLRKQVVTSMVRATKSAPNRDRYRARILWRVCMLCYSVDPSIHRDKFGDESTSLLKTFGILEKKLDNTRRKD